MKRALVLLFAAAALLAQRPSLAITLDGHLDPEYGPPRSTQTTQTNFQDSQIGQLDLATGSELDQAYGVISNGVLYLFLSGNLGGYYLGSELHPADRLDLFIDSSPGGENPIRNDSPEGFYGQPRSMAGLTFDTGFAPDHWFECYLYNFDPHRLEVQYAELPTDGGGTSYYMGEALPGSAGTLSGGTNPYGVLATIDNANTAGVTAGCAAASGAGPTAGLEMAIPLAALGSSGDCIRVMAVVYSDVALQVTNQTLGPLPVGTCDLGRWYSTVDFRAYAGDQFFSICATPVSAGEPGAGRVQLSLDAPSPNPATGSLTISFALPDARPATLEVLDVGGRRVAAREVGSLGPGRHEWTLPARLPAGVYFVRLSRGGILRARRTVVL
jgi:hypothetical protein